MKLRVYVDTSVVGGCFDKEFEEWSGQLFEEFISGEKIAVISDVTLEELSHAREKIRKQIDIIPDEYKEYVLNSEESEILASKYVSEGAVTNKFYEDALHIALATIYGVDVLVSWNFKHIVNLHRIKKYNAVNLMSNYSMIEIRNPREILKEQ